MRTHIVNGDGKNTFCGLIGRGPHATVYAAIEREMNEERARRSHICKRCSAAFLRNLSIASPAAAGN